MKLGRLREWRESEGFTQKELAAMAQVSEFTIANSESGGDTRPNTARKLAGAMGLKVADLQASPPVPLGKGDPLSGAGAQETSEMLDNLDSKTRNLADTNLIGRLEVADDVEYVEIIRQCREELGLLLPELGRLGKEVKPRDDAYMFYTKVRSWVSQQNLAVDILATTREPEPQEGAVRWEEKGT
jgi:transcriptional regulator with XRE-family HTH domain